MSSAIPRLVPSLVVSACLIACGSPAGTEQSRPHVERTGNFRGSTLSAAQKDGALFVMVDPPLPRDNETLIAVIHDAIAMFYDVDRDDFADWRTIGDALRFEVEDGGAFDVVPVKDEDSGGRLAGLILTRAPK